MPPPPQHPFSSSFFVFLSLLLHFSKNIYCCFSFFWGGGSSNHLANSSPLKKIYNPPPLKHPFSSSFSFYLFSFTFQKIYIFFLGGGGGLNHLANSYVHICSPPHMFLSFFTLKQNGKTPCR